MVGALERLQPVAERPGARVLAGVDLRPEVVVPAVEELEQRRRPRCAGLAIGSTTCSSVRKSPQPSTLAASRYSRGIVSRNCRSRKIEKASPKRHRDDQRPQRAGQVQLLRPDQVHRDDHDLRRQHHRRDHHHHRQVAAPEPEPGQGVGDREARHQRSARCRATAYTIVLRHQVRKPGVCQTSTRLCHCQVCGQQLPGQRLLVAHHRGQEDEDERQHEEQRSATREGVHRDPLQATCRTAGSASAAPCVGASGRRCRWLGLRHHSSPSKPLPRRISTAVKAIESANSTSATTHAAPMSKRWKPRL